MDQTEFSREADGHSAALYARAMNLTRDEDDAKDLVQDTLVKGIRFCGSFDKGTNIRSWLYVIMRNTFINDWHRLQRKRAVVDNDAELSSPALLASSVRNGAESEFAMGDIRKAMLSIPEAYRIPFQRYFEGYKYHEISAELSLPLGTVKTHIHQARLLLKKYLKQYREVG